MEELKKEQNLRPREQVGETDSASECSRGTLDGQESDDEEDARLLLVSARELLKTFMVLHLLWYSISVPIL
jgi:hypothetical protein